MLVLLHTLFYMNFTAILMFRIYSHFISYTIGKDKKTSISLLRKRKMTTFLEFLSNFIIQKLDQTRDRENIVTK